LTGGSGHADLTQKEEGKKAVKRTQVRVNEYAVMAELECTHLWTVVILKHWDFQLQLFISPDLDDVADPMLNLLGRQFFFGAALGIIDSAILAHQCWAVLKWLDPP
jgi:hypothetical protein